MFRFKQFTVIQHRSAMKVTTDACLFGAWVTKQLEGRKTQTFKLFDIGAGTGLLSLMVAQECIHANVVAIEVDRGSFVDLQVNCKGSPWADRLHPVMADVLEFPASHMYDVIVSNPPFYGNEWSSPDPGRKLAHHGSSLRLEDLPELVKKHLSPIGEFFFLLPYKRSGELKALFEENQLYIHKWLLARQTPSHEPFRIFVKGSLKPALLTNFDEITLKDSNGNYTREFGSLLHGYYLKDLHL